MVNTDKNPKLKKASVIVDRRTQFEFVRAKNLTNFCGHANIDIKRGNQKQFSADCTRQASDKITQSSLSQFLM
jgi:hypothetical protein